jgi:hypothetical protein
MVSQKEKYVLLYEAWVYLKFCIHCRGFWVLHHTKTVKIIDIYAVFAASFLKDDPDPEEGGRGSKFLQNIGNYDFDTARQPEESTVK